MEEGSAYNADVPKYGKLENDSFAGNFTPYAVTDFGNFTINFTGEVPRPSKNPYVFYQTEQLVFLWVLFIMIVLGNSSVLAALMLSKSKKSRMNFFIMQLAIADLSVGLIHVLTDIVWKFTLAWYAGTAACKIVKFLCVLVTYSSTYVLVALSIDRYDAITHPMNFSGSWIRARWLIAIAWMMSGLFSIPMLILTNEKVDEYNVLQCTIEMPDRYWKLYMSLVAVSLFIIPALIITACYTIIVMTIWSKGKILTPVNQCTKTPEDGVLTPKRRAIKGTQPFTIVSHKSLLGEAHSDKCVNKDEQIKGMSKDGDADTKRASSRGLIPKAKIKTVKMTFAIVIVFILCYSPYFIYDLLQVYEVIPNDIENMGVTTFIQSLAPLNSAANPIIYCLFSTHICRNLRKIPLFNWIGEHVFLCCPAMQRPLRESTSTRRSDYTTMSESLSRSSRRSNGNSTRYGANLALKSSVASRKYIVSAESLENNFGCKNSKV